ncbi:apolipoprotein N-acyltransferase [Leptothermofonsia sichuanensis E412]|uniref:apolipoprotein N-acyltransferase n=1 Tax=Leptothermofonsia sichuanensis TaxID=2917832 RepID=UPI001CA7831D|nr:apolipoprotein N-acyltransferase [Leptothermofonsia sichuanensis]QZZ22241.1 apolipoprotein N-acyltransferase [Leptothermofonsia sichuanensis E412]
MLAKNPLLPLAIALGSGILMALATAPLNVFSLAWVALVPLWVLAFGADSITATPHQPPESINERSDARQVPSRVGVPRSHRSPTHALALAWGIGYHGLALSWITGLHPLTWLGMSWIGSVAVTLFCWAFITLWGAVLVVIWVWAVRKLTAPPFHFPPSVFPYARILLATALWCSLEWVWSLGSLYWTSLSYTQSPGNLAILHLGRLSGPSVVTAAIVAVNGLLAEAWIGYRTARKRLLGNVDATGKIRTRSGMETQRYPNPQAQMSSPYLLLTLAISFGMALHLVGFGLYNQPLIDSDQTGLKVGIIQGNVPTRVKLSPAGVRRAIQAYVNGYQILAGQGVDAVLTPEGALPVLWDETNKQSHPFYPAVIDQGVVAWLGTFTSYGGRVAQSLLTLTGSGETYSQYHKIKLVPLGEYVPLQEILGGLINRLSPIEADMMAGTSAQRFDTPFGRAIASICYESAFPALFRAQAVEGGQFILTASNLDPYSEVLMAQHQAQDLMRAIETDRWAIRATNTGYSGIIDPHGRVIWRSQPNTYELHVERIGRRQTQTLYVRWGDWLTPLLAGIVAVIWLKQAIAARPQMD